MRRIREPEWMDDPRLNPAELAAALRSLDRTNALAGVHGAILRSMRRLDRGRIACVLDVASGGGGFLRYLQQRREAASMTLVGVDLSDTTIRYAAARIHAAKANGQAGMIFVRANATALPFRDAGVDVVTSGLFLHHLDPPEVVAALSEARRVARCGVIMIDLRRSRLALAFTWLMTRVLSRSRVFHSDGVRSVRAAYTVTEMRCLARQAGLDNATVRGCFPFRMIIAWSKH